MAKSIEVPQPKYGDWQRFMQKVLKDEQRGCWLWIGAKFEKGYGMFFLAGKRRRAHRVMYVWTYGEVEDGQVLDHICRNRGCVNPDHLRPKTNTENVLIGKGITAQNKRKSVCVNGHPFSEKNIYDDLRGWRGCAICRKEAVYKHRDANREEINRKRREKRVRIVHEPIECSARDCVKMFIPIRKTGKFCSTTCQQRERNALKSSSSYSN